MTAVKTHTSCVAQTIAPARTIAVGKFIRDLLAQASNQEPTSGGLPREKRRGPPEERCRRSFRLRRLSPSASSLRTLSFSLSLHTNRGSFRFRTNPPKQTFGPKRDHYLLLHICGQACGEEPLAVL